MSSGPAREFERVALPTLLGINMFAAPAIRDAGFNVVGVYMAWRGKLTPVPVLKELSFWNRKRFQSDG